MSSVAISDPGEPLEELQTELGFTTDEIVVLSRARLAASAAG